MSVTNLSEDTTRDIPQARSAADIFSLIQKSEAAPPNDSDDLKDRYRQAASVLVAVEDIDQLLPVGATGAPGEARRLLRSELLKVAGRKFEGSFMLSPEARRKGIASLETHDQRRQALDANPGERVGELQRELEKYLLAAPLPLSLQSREELQATLQVATWLHGVVETVPPPDQVRFLLDRAAFAAVFEGIAGDAIFRGRRKELDDLRRYVGVLEPESLLRRLAGRAFRWSPPERMPAVSISGPGGIGKSALVARFMLEHLRLPAKARIPFAYLDFDRPGLSISEPATLLAEMLRQIDLQFREEGYFRELNDFFKSRIGAAELSGEKEPEKYLELVRSVIADLVGLIDQNLGPRPYVIVLDTFEEVQYRGEHRAEPFWEILDYLQHVRPFLRVIISGRARADTLILADQSPEHIDLAGLDDDAAIAFMNNRGISDRNLATALLKQFGGVPLSLKLAASLVNRDAASRESVKGVAGKSTFWLSASDEEIQGELFSRIIGYIHTPAVQRLAHPGFAVRRVSPSVILNVLNEPCGLAISTDAEATALFDELRQETSLVVADTADGTLVHRTDLRRVMLKLLVAKAPAQVKAIHQSAAAWYAMQTGWRAKAEELYHSLQLSILQFDQGFNDPEVRSSLQASMSELPVSAQTFLATFGYQVSEDVLAKASLEERDAHLAAQVEDLLPYGARSCQRASQMLESGFRRDHASPLFRSEARLLAIQQGQLSRALNSIEEGLRWSVSEGHARETLDLLCEQAWLLRFELDSDDLRVSLANLDEHARRLGDWKAMLQWQAQAFELESRQSGRSTTSTALLQGAAEILERISSQDLWDVFPLIGILIDPLSEEFYLSCLKVMNLLRDDTGPFHRVEFPADKFAMKLLSELLSMVQSGDVFSISSPTPNGQPNPVIQLVGAFCKAWPYQVLRVRPPYSQATFASSEGVA